MIDELGDPRGGWLYMMQGMQEMLELALTLFNCSVKSGVAKENDNSRQQWKSSLARGQKQGRMAASASYGGGSKKPWMHATIRV